ncbi:hypothetical protein [Pseudonocardia sp. WMMC193]|uniref:hypothetical protein n=1 Tax=Pseudonocardia sp. WMMC193 TaxID=2911965 RepID=UPI001F1B4F3E|nr:hypothetical protein [Pseudonocardia sp. WMMC193]MCF7552584.1 hypothetical protein [Pseudonocardia sp. WMMC193]
MTDSANSDAGETPAATVLERMLAAKLGEDRAHEYLRTQWVRCADEIITDPGAVVPRFVIKPPPITENV